MNLESAISKTRETLRLKRLALATQGYIHAEYLSVPSPLDSIAI